MSDERRVRVAVFSELPTPYRWPVFARLLDEEELDLRIFFCARGEKDREWSFDFRPDGRVRFLPVTTLSIMGRRTIHYHVNPTVFGVLRSGRFDVVVIPGYAMFVSQAAALWCRANRTPYVMFSETTLGESRRLAVRAAKRAVLPVLVGGASAWLGTGRMAERYLVHYGAEPDRVFRFPNTPDVDFFRDGARRAAGEREAVRARHGAGNAPVILFVGRLIGVKRPDLLLRAVAALRDRGAEPALWLAGDGADRAGLEALRSELGLARTRFLGNVPTSELPSLYAAADLFVLPSDHEPWGAVVCEAMACGLPVILSDAVGSAPDLVEEGGNGRVFPAADLAGLVEALGGLLADPGGLRRMGARSAERMQTFTHRECAREFLGAVRAARARDR